MGLEIKFHKVLIKKRFPLAISRGIKGDSHNLFVEYKQDGISGWGEVAPGETENARTVEIAQDELNRLIENGIENFSVKEINNVSREMQIAPCAFAGLDMAIWDWKAKEAKVPLYELLGITKPFVPTSVTIGINPPSVIKERIPLILAENKFKALKIKLGSPEGIESDKEMFCQVMESNKKFNAKVRVDANGGWSTEDAVKMIKWLADRDVEYIEQPLKEGQEEELKYLYKSSVLPIYADESCRFSEDINKLAGCVDGVNMKLMKCGGITEALRIIDTAKSFNLKTMIGCMSESSVAISAAASISGNIDYIDLDSHYNLDPDPAFGAFLLDGVTVPRETAGHGGILKEEFYA